MRIRECHRRDAELSSKPPPTAPLARPSRDKLLISGRDRNWMSPNNSLVVTTTASSRRRLRRSATPRYLHAGQLFTSATVAEQHRYVATPTPNSPVTLGRPSPQAITARSFTSSPTAADANLDGVVNALGLQRAGDELRRRHRQLLDRSDFTTNGVVSTATSPSSPQKFGRGTLCPAGQRRARSFVPEPADGQVCGRFPMLLKRRRR